MNFTEIRKKVLNRETVTYLIAGIMTTVVSLSSYWLLNRLFTSHELFGKYAYLAASTISSALAIIFAFFVNKVWVFQSKCWQPKLVAREAITFAGARISSLLLEQLLMFLLVTLLIENTISPYLDSRTTQNVITSLLEITVIYRDDLSKIFISVIIVILNYFLSKFVIFTKRNK